LNQLKEKLDFEGLKIDKSFSLVTPELAMAVSIARKVQSARMKENPSQFFLQSWKNFPDIEMRLEIVNWYQKKLSEWEWNEGLTLDCSPLLPVVHGTDTSIVGPLIYIFENNLIFFFIRHGRLHKEVLHPCQHSMMDITEREFIFQHLQNISFHIMQQRKIQPFSYV